VAVRDSTNRISSHSASGSQEIENRIGSFDDSDA